MSMHTTGLSASGLAVGYWLKKNKNILFEDLNLVLNPGQLVCFMGPNGIGKSSLIRTLAGLQKPLAGKIETNAPGDDSNAPRQIAVVLTDRISAVNLTVYEIIAFGRYPYLDWSIRLSDADKRIIDSSIAQTHIAHLLDKKLHELSDGQLQMVMIARALAQDTPIILLDEPTAHLDLNNRVEIMKLLKTVSHVHGKAILVATHELDLALQMADWIWLAGNDKNILTGIPEELVLDGAFDKIFQFKGFDLKTGKVQHEKYRQVTVCLSGSGYEYLWTKNALERHGFDVTDQSGPIKISIIKNKNSLQWYLKKPAGEKYCETLTELINLL